MCLTSEIIPIDSIRFHPKLHLWKVGWSKGAARAACFTLAASSWSRDQNWRWLKFPREMSNQVLLSFSARSVSSYLFLCLSPSLPLSPSLSFSLSASIYLRMPCFAFVLKDHLNAAPRLHLPRYPPPTLVPDQSVNLVETGITLTGLVGCRGVGMNPEVV